jgi:siroheme decarboxylase
MNPSAEPTSKTVLDELDKQLLNGMQFDFPLSASPWDTLAQGMGLTGAQVLSRVRRLKDTGIIRQISAIFDTRALGYTSTLAAARIPEGRLDLAAAVVSRHPGVSHNYKREAEFNLWFTLAVPPGESLDGHLKRLANEARFEDYLALPTIRTFRIGVKLDVGGGHTQKTDPQPAKRHNHQADPVALTQDDRAYIRALQEDLPLEECPFEQACLELGVTFDELRSWMQKMQENGVMRRFAAILRHRQAGFAANGMVVWRVADEHIQQAGELAAQAPEVSHCYQRPCSDAWPYNLYTMIHARSEPDCQQVIDRIAAGLAPLGMTSHRTLYSTTEYKKQRVRYFTQEHGSHSVPNQ